MLTGKVKNAGIGDRSGDLVWTVPLETLTNIVPSTAYAIEGRWYTRPDGSAWPPLAAPAVHANDRRLYAKAACRGVL